MPRTKRAVDPQSKRFGDHLRQIRRERGLTQEQVAEGLGVTPAAYQHYEAGRNEPRFTSTPKLAGILGVHPCALLDPFVPEPAPPLKEPSQPVRDDAGAYISRLITRLPDTEQDKLIAYLQVRAELET